MRYVRAVIEHPIAAQWRECRNSISVYMTYLDLGVILTDVHRVVATNSDLNVL